MSAAPRLATVCCAYLLAAGAGLWWWLRSMGAQPSGADTLVCLLPALVGVALATTSRQDWRQYVARLAAAAVFLPILLLMWGSSQDLPAGSRVWPFAVGFSVAHALLFCVGVLWAGAATTTVRAARATVPMPVEVLMARLLSLNNAGAPLLVSAGAARGEWRVDFAHPDVHHRAHRVTLHIDPALPMLRVRETLRAWNTAPQDAAEADMRGPGDPALDPTRPQARRTWALTAQTTLIEPARLAALPLILQGERVELPAEFARALDPEGMVTLLCAVVTRSGFDWQPVFFESQG